MKRNPLISYQLACNRIWKTKGKKFFGINIKLQVNQSGEKIYLSISRSHSHKLRLATSQLLVVLIVGQK